MGFKSAKLLKSCLHYVFILTIIIGSFGIFQLNNGTVTAATNSGELQQSFKKAAEEFGVPIEVLMAVSYHQSRWDEHDGHSEVGGYGVMNLIDIPLNNDANGKNEANFQSTMEQNDTSLEKAAKLLRIDKEN